MPVLVPDLPPGYRARPTSTDDVPALHALVAACERELYGHPETDPGSIAAVFARPGLVTELDTLLVHDRSGQPVARAWVNRRSEVDVHPQHRGHGLGSALLDWAEARARQAGDEQLAQTVPNGDVQAVTLLRSRGYEPKVTQWLLEYTMTDEPPLPEPVPGIAVRPFRAGDEQAAHLLIQDAFDDWQQRRHPFREWAEHTVARPAFAPGLSALAFATDPSDPTGGLDPTGSLDPTGELVGAVLAMDLPETAGGYVEEVAVRHDHRNRGIARLLLHTVFRAFHQHGRRTCTLWTHSDTGALDLYLRVGMQVQRSSTVFKKPLTQS
ncbi:GNAT family N-acetyltransferase [Kitasatospora sp. LaBMicrA B282]|uniref:GNAT family N-acetyltransferase n=1 Tax=Kitasatospora sp. LaBMicrA B282 TaxID=3420949 RepID=UPI003D0B121D